MEPLASTIIKYAEAGVYPSVLDNMTIEALHKVRDEIYGNKFSTFSAAQDAAATYVDQELYKRNMDPNVGGGVDRDKLPASAFVDPKNKRFPIVEPKDVEDAVSSFGRADPPIPLPLFRRRLISIARRMGPTFVAKLPKAWGVLR